MATITLCMIVKNETATIRRCLESVRDYIDSYVIVDTGSTDDTMKLISESLIDVPGVLEERPWVDFGHNRNELLMLARPWGDYLLLLDADMTVDFGTFTIDPTYDSYLLPYSGGLSYRQTLLVRNRHGFKYVGRTHEYITTHNKNVVCTHPTHPLVTHHGDGGMRPEKLTRDYDLLSTGDMDDPRTVFYLAHTCEHLGKHEEAIEWFTKRSTMGAFEEEAWHAQFSAAKLKREWAALVEAWERRPWRLEPLYEAVNILRQETRYKLGYLFSEAGIEILTNDNRIDQDILFVEKWVYDYGLPFEHAILCYYNDEKKESKFWNELLLREPTLPPMYRRAVESNLEFLK